MKRYRRQIKLDDVGSSGQKKLGQSNVTIIGAGGLGVPASLYLAGSGIGTINLIDFDIVELSNLHRQVIFTEKDIGQSKSDVLAQHLKSLNSEISINSYNQRFDAACAKRLLQNTDVVLDCSDNLETRYLINDACIILDIPFVSASIYQYEAQLSIFNYKNGPSFRCLYESWGDAAAVATCEDIGVLGTLPGIIGSMQANEVIKMILNLGNLLSGKVLLTNILNYNTSIFKLDRNESNFERVKQRDLLPETKKWKDSVGIEWEEVLELIEKGKVKFIDIREIHEAPRFDSNLISVFPLNQNFETNFSNSDSAAIICFCQSGIRSIVAAQKLRDIGINQAYSLNKGLIPLINSNMFKVKKEELI